MTAVTRRRVARKPHRCGCGTSIPVGDVYLTHTAFPGSDFAHGKRPERIIECARCAVRYGREYDLGDVPVEQAYGQGLV